MYSAVCIMAERKRTNPQRIDVERDARRFSFYQHIPRQRQLTIGSGVLQMQQISLPEFIGNEPLTKSSKNTSLVVLWRAYTPLATLGLDGLYASLGKAPQKIN